MTDASLLSGTPDAAAEPPVGDSPEALAAAEAAKTAAAEAAKTAAAEAAKTAAAEAAKGELTEYADFTLPEGFALDADVAGEFKTLALGKKYSQEDAQGLVDIAAKLVQGQATKAAEAWANQRKVWREEVAADKEIGGANQKENLGYAAKALDQFAPELRELLDSTGWGDNPVFVRAFVRIGKAISEDRLVGGAQQQGGVSRTPESVLYGPK